MSLYLVVPFLALVAVIQSTIIPLLKVGGAKPDLLLLVVISWSLLRGGQEGLVWGFVGGLCLDVLSGGPLGASAIALMVVGLLSGQGETNIFRGNILLPMFVAPLGTLVYYGLLLVILELAGTSLPVLRTFSQVILPAAIVNMIAMPFVYVFMRWLNRKVERRAMYW